MTVTRLKTGRGLISDTKFTLDSIFLDGECYAFAIALHQGLGWPLIGIMEGDVIRHALVKIPNDSPVFRDSKIPHGQELLFDARGCVSEDEIGLPFGLTPPWNSTSITIEQLYAVREIQEASITLARQMAEIVWPHLPWKENFDDQVVNFLTAIEAVCREHGFMIRSHYPTAKPIISPCTGDEDGFRVERISRDQAVFDRKLK
ncbi:MAG: hypothetical protein AAGA35_00580 [Patescibacteria group bacterium]